MNRLLELVTSFTLRQLKFKLTLTKFEEAIKM